MRFARAAKMRSRLVGGRKQGPVALTQAWATASRQPKVERLKRFLFTFALTFLVLGAPADAELISTVNENIKKIRIDPRYQDDSKTQLLIKEVLSQVGKNKPKKKFHHPLFFRL